MDVPALRSKLINSASSSSHSGDEYVSGTGPNQLRWKSREISSSTVAAMDDDGLDPDESSCDEGDSGTFISIESGGTLSCSRGPRKGKRRKGKNLTTLRIPVVLCLFVAGVTLLGALRLAIGVRNTSDTVPGYSATESVTTSVTTRAGHVETVAWRGSSSRKGHADQNDESAVQMELAQLETLSSSSRNGEIKPSRVVEEEDVMDDDSDENAENDSLEQQVAAAVEEATDAAFEADSDEQEQEQEQEARWEPSVTISATTSETSRASVVEVSSEADEYDSAENSKTRKRKSKTEQAQQGRVNRSGSASSSSSLSSSNTGASPYIPLAQLSPRIAKTFAYFKGSCLSFCKAIVKAGYRMMPGLTAPAHPEFLIISYKSVNKYANVKTSIVNQIGYGSSCIGGGKGKQLACKEDFAKEHGCSYSKLGVQPPQWNLKYPAECKKFFAAASSPELAEQIWIVKPGGAFHGAGIKLYNGISKLKLKYRCNDVLGDGVIVQRYVDKPALFGGHKFDFRSYMLIASMNPYIVFYHDGFVRRSEHAYNTDASDLNNPLAHITNARGQSSKNHFFSFEQLGETLASESGFAPDFIEKTVRPHLKRTTNFVFQAARRKFTHRNVRFQLFALDWMLGADGSMVLLEANGNPQTTNYPGLSFAPTIWTSMLDLVHQIQVEPETLPRGFTAKDRFKHIGWDMVYNELEETHDQESYDPCKLNQYAVERHPLFSFEPKQ